MQKIRIASFNVALDRTTPGALAAEIESGSPQLYHLAAMVQQVRPDILLLNEFDHGGEASDTRHLTAFAARYLAAGKEGIEYPHRYLTPVNTGLAGPLALNGGAVPVLPQDGLGFGAFHGQYGFAMLSRFPLETTRLRTFRRFLWQNMPGARLPRCDGQSYYCPEVLAFLPLSSKNHVDLPVRLPDGRLLHLLACHPAPPIDEGPERRNSCRNHDELRLWHDYIQPGRGDYLIDDQGRQGGLAPGSDFVILGDLNADPADGNGYRSRIRALLADPLLNQEVSRGRLRPASEGARRLRPLEPRRGPARLWTHVNGLRLDYVLPSAGLEALASGVHWPAPEQDESGWFWRRNGRPARRSQGSDHRLVWVDIAL
ncbi:endonuclease/exonuclease/phosphatase family protein [Oceanimonas sp. CHS3-5]|uniref:endonuclease/exonuclease/phosphatase family protein n=1 Tax=Oceanimonas sp. CHS3-5 TaxID=3068186 RepID=UPI00273FB351|nr:endonuclease/exonuclease/phosphatase family protein [Oceanimonas sp. CHS3-5]MDP5293233.1 endonuclease/exonuclease/phosphatase family protein [Oceanimonas sp. CHS3-5]